MAHANAAESGAKSRSTRKSRQEKLIPLDKVPLGASIVVGLLAFVIALIYAYWPTLAWAEDAWRNEPDYSHGYLVVPLAAMLCWHRRDSFPGIRSELSWIGLGLMAFAIVMRIASRVVFADFLDGWSILPMVAGAIWLLAGPAALRWSLPAVAFLFLMIPMPYQAESLLSWKLQGFATHLSTVFLRVVGFPAVAEGHVIWLGDQPLEVAAACSGMRIFMGVIALAFFWAAMMRRGWVDRIVLMAVSIPLAIFVNAVRITAIGVMYTWFPSDAAHRSIHTNSGLLMIPFAFVLLWGFKAYWEQLYRPNEQISASQLARGAA
tara:strand:+ start:46411 stop:47370 length:960 start_codon:yes stop_codon:yes gene_type:complete